MNPTILKKAIDELKEEKPRIDYVLGMLETLYEMSERRAEVTIPKPVIAGIPLPLTNPNLTDEAAILDATAIARIAGIKRMGGNDTPQ